MMNQSDKKEGLKIVREFKAPIAMVFDAFAKPEAISQWWGPEGMSMSVLQFDFKQGGKMHYKLEGNDQIMWGLFQYQKINHPNLVEFVSSFSDENANICKSPFPMDFPLEIYNQLTLVENNGITTITLSGHPINATAEQEATYYSIIENMNQGFAGTFNQLEMYLNKIQQQ